LVGHAYLLLDEPSGGYTPVKKTNTLGLIFKVELF